MMIAIGTLVTAKTNGWCKRCTNHFGPGQQIKYLGAKTGWGHPDCPRKKR